MALTITTTIPIINPVYTPLEFTISSPGADYMELDIYIGDSSKGQYEGTKRTQRINDTSRVVDIQNVIQPFFTTDASATIELKRIDVVGRSWLNNVSTWEYDDKYYIFNGINRNNWDPSIYIMNGEGDAKFLNEWDTDINIHWGNENTKLYFFQGTFENSTGSYVANAPSFKVTRDSNTCAGYTFASSTTPIIREFNIGPTNLNNIIPDLSINENTSIYTINPSDNSTNYGLKTINITNKSNRCEPKRLSWVDTFGCIESFNFDLIGTNTINVSRNKFNNNGTLKTYNNKIVDNYSMTSNWITEDAADNLKSAWHSQSTIVDGEYIIINNKSIPILRRREDRLINYIIDYEAAVEYITQIF